MFWRGALTLSLIGGVGLLPSGGAAVWQRRGDQVSNAAFNGYWSGTAHVTRVNGFASDLNLDMNVDATQRGSQVSGTMRWYRLSVLSRARVNISGRVTRSGSLVLHYDRGPGSGCHITFTGTIQGSTASGTLTGWRPASCGLYDAGRFTGTWVLEKLP